MKNNFEIFDEHFQTLTAMVEQKQFSNCASMCSDLANYSAMSNYQDGVLISEILEGIFEQIRYEFKRMNIPNMEQQDFIAELKDSIMSIGATYKDDDKNSTYDALKKARNLATQFQIKCWNTFRTKSSPLPNRPAGRI